jgi:hypothetical protein
MRADRCISFTLTACLSLIGCGREFRAPPPAGGVQGDLDLEGQPGVDLSGARVRLVECGLTAVPARDGTFRLDGVPDGDYTLRVELTLWLAGQAEVYAYSHPQSVPVRGPAIFPLGSLELLRAGQASGLVRVGGGGSPLNAVVYALEGEPIAQVGDSGRFLLRGLPAGRWRLSALRPGLQARAPVEVEVLPGRETGGIELVLEAIPEGLGEVRGRVLLGNPGPEPGVTVELIDAVQGARYRARTDAQGGFSRSGLSPGAYHLEASHPGYRVAGLPFLEVRAGSVLELPAALVLPPADGPAGAFPWDGDPTGNLDDDGDGWPDLVDNCPLSWNPDQADADGNGLGDACQGASSPDADGDGVPDGIDNCPGVYNPGQENRDGDNRGDACQEEDPDPPDRDADGVEDTRDNCPDHPNPDQADLDRDGQGDACDPDLDGDGMPNHVDNCPAVFNLEQADLDEDGEGDACDPDLDGDGIPNDVDNCPELATAAPLPDFDGDGLGDDCDPDVDGDGVEDTRDNCPRDHNPDQANQDGDPHGDACDPDIDDDGVANTVDNCPLVPNPGQELLACNWPAALVLGAQDAAGDVQLVATWTTPWGWEERWLTAEPGDAWGPAADERGWVVFHHRPRPDPAEPEPPYRLCALDLNAPGALVCARGPAWDGLGHAMHPSLCPRALNGERMLLYELHTPDGARLWSVELPPSLADFASLRPGQDLALDAFLEPPARVHNYREPVCTGADSLDYQFSFAADFLPESAAPEGPVAWRIHQGLAPVPAGPAHFARAENWTDPRGSYTLRHPAGLSSTGTTFFEASDGARSQVMAWNEVWSQVEPLTAGTAEHRAPALFPLPEGPTWLVGLLACQVLEDGGSRVLVRQLEPRPQAPPRPAGPSWRLAPGAGWAGSPAWSPVIPP